MEACALPNVATVIDMCATTETYTRGNARLQRVRAATSDEMQQRSLCARQNYIRVSRNEECCVPIDVACPKPAAEAEAASVCDVDDPGSAIRENLVLRHAMAGPDRMTLDTSSPWFKHTLQSLVHDGLIAAEANCDSRLRLTEAGAAAALLPLTPKLSSFLLECSNSDLFLEGILAVSLATIESQFWLTPSDSVSSDSGPRRGGAAAGVRHDDAAVKDIVASVVGNCIEVLKSVGAINEQAAISLSQLGRKLTEGQGLKLPKDQKLRSVLQGVAGIVFCGDLQSRAGPTVYFSATEASAAACDSSSPGAESSSNVYTAVDKLRESSDLAAGVCALLALWHTSPPTQSEFQKTCREMSIYPSACIDAIQRVNCLMRSLWLIDQGQLPQSMSQSSLVKQIKSKSFADLKSDLSAAFKFLPIVDHETVRTRATVCTSGVSVALATMGNIAESHFPTQTFEIFAAFGECKCRILLPDGSSVPSCVPLKTSLSDFQSCLGVYMSASISAAEGGLNIAGAARAPSSRNTASPLRNAIVCASALAIDTLQATSALPSHPACITSRTSRQEVSVFGPDAAVEAACVSIRDAIAKITPQLAAVPRVWDKETSMLEANHRAIFGQGFNALSVLAPDESNVVEILNAGCYLSIVSGKSRWLKPDGYTLSALKQAFEEMCLDKLFPPPHSKNHPFAVDAKDLNGQHMISVSFISSAAAAAARALLSQLPNSASFHVVPAVSVLSNSNPNSAFRVAFVVSNVAPAVKQQEKSLVKEKTVNGQKYYAVRMACCNKSGWHRGMDLPSDDPVARPPIPVRHDFRTAELYQHAERKLHNHSIACCSSKSLFTTHNALRRTNVKHAAYVKWFKSANPQEEPPIKGLWIPHDVFAHSGHKCLHSEACPCTYVDGAHRVTLDHLPRWSCCDAPYVDHDEELFCNCAPRQQFVVYDPNELCHYCWETHYFVSPADAQQAAQSSGAREFHATVTTFEEKKKKNEAKSANAQMVADRSGGGWGAPSAGWTSAAEAEQAAAAGADQGQIGCDLDNDDELLMAQFPVKPGSPGHRYVLTFSKPDLASKAKEIMTHSRQLHFSLGSIAGSNGQEQFQFGNVNCKQNNVVFNIMPSHGKGCVPLPNRHILLGVLKHWGCSGIERLDVLPEANASSDGDAFLDAIILAAARDVEAAVVAQGIPKGDFKVICDPTTVTHHRKSSTHSFHGLYGCQSLSFVVQMQSQEACRTTVPKLQRQLLGSAKSGLVYQDMSYDTVCCEVREDTSKSVLLPSNVPMSFAFELQSKLEEFRMKMQEHTSDILNWSIGSACLLPSGSEKTGRLRLVVECSEESLVVQALKYVRSFVNGVQVVPEPSLVWWPHSEQAADFMKSLQSSCSERGVSMVIQASSAMVFYGDFDACIQLRGVLHSKLAEISQSQEQSSQVAIVVTQSQLNQFLKRHASLKAAAAKFSPQVQQIRAMNVDGKWQLVISASPDGVKAIRDDVLAAPPPAAQKDRQFRYVCPICDEGSDCLNDDWLVSLTCGCILHLECARTYYSCNEQDAMDPLKPSRLYPLNCFGLDASGKKCCRPFAQYDIGQLVQDPAQMQSRVIEELSRFACFKSSGWRMCPVPIASVNCKLLYRVAPQSQSWSTRTCEGCGFEHCASCEAKPHPHGMSCKEAGGEQVVHDPLAGLDRSKCVNALRIIAIL